MANEGIKAQTARVRLQRIKGDPVDRNRAVAAVFDLARRERDSWLNLPPRVATNMAADPGGEAHRMELVLDRVLRAHLAEMAEVKLEFRSMLRRRGRHSGHLARAPRPDPALTDSQWGDRHRVLSSRPASEAGPYRTSRTPYMSGIMLLHSPLIVAGLSALWSASVLRPLLSRPHGSTRSRPRASRWPRRAGFRAMYLLPGRT